MTHDGIGKYVSTVVKKAEGPTDNIVKILKDTHTDVVINFLPVGSEMATKWYVEQVMDAGCAFVNGIPVLSPVRLIGASGLRSAACPSSAMTSKASWARRLRTGF